MSAFRITSHVVDRFIERVDPTASRAHARRVLTEFLTRGKCRTTPRHWMDHVSPARGKRFIYWADLPGVCLVVIDGVAVTLLTRDLVRARRLATATVGSPSSQVGRDRFESRHRWRWDGADESE